MGAFLIDNDSCILFHNDTNSGSSSGISAHTGYRQALPHWPLKDLKTSLFFSGWSDLTIKCLLLCHMGQSCFFFISQMIMLNEIPKYPLFFHLSPLLKFGHYGWSEYSRLHCIVNILNACQLYKKKLEVPQKCSGTPDLEIILAFLGSRVIFQEFSAKLR